jgi:hypothetical protein
VVKDAAESMGPDRAAGADAAGAIPAAAPASSSAAAKTLTKRVAN